MRYAQAQHVNTMQYPQALYLLSPPFSNKRRHVPSSPVFQHATKTGIPYSSKFSRYNIFVNFVIEFAITKILFTKYLYVRIVLLCRRAVAKFIFHELWRFRAIHEIFVPRKFGAIRYIMNLHHAGRHYGFCWLAGLEQSLFFATYDPFPFWWIQVLHYYYN